MNKHIPLEALAELFHNLSDLDRAGFPLREALTVLSQVPPHPRLKTVLQDICQEIQAGFLLSQALTHQSFAPFIIQIIVVGEKTGKLAPYYQDIEHHLRWQVQLSQTLTRALRYGLILLTLIISMLIAATTYLLPHIEELLMGLGIKDLPWPTRSLLSLSHALGSIGGVLMSLPLLILVAARYQPAVLRYVPGWGSLLLTQNWTYFLKNLAALLTARVDLLLALQQASQAVTFPYLAKRLSQVPALIAAGYSLSEALATQPYFPPLALRLIQLGETTGKLPALVTHAATNCQQAYAQRVEHFAKQLHPVFVVTLGSLILWIVLATLLPLYQHLEVMG